MHAALFWLSLLSPPLVSARLIHSLPEDPFAFPKFKVSFLNNLPLLNQTAQRWLANGLQGGELEFLDQPWDDRPSSDAPRKEIGGADPNAASISTSSLHPEYSLEHMKMGPRDSYLCFIPKALNQPRPTPEVVSDADVTPAHIWSLLKPLSGTCLYHRQGWFTYSYCHDREIRQFKELIQPSTQSTGTYKPEEDPDSHHFTLGRAPVSPEPGVELTIAEQNANTANLELAGSPGSRYLVQRWGSGTLCDKTGKRRETEIQFHCSTAGPDSILFIKEAPTCSYVLVINTPRLCSEPGFKPRRESGEQAQIRCREIIDTPPSQTSDLGSTPLPDTDYPLKIPRVKPILPPPQAKLPELSKGGKGGLSSDAIRKAVQAWLGKNKDLKVQEGQQVVVQAVGADGEVVFEILDDVDVDLASSAEGLQVKEENAAVDGMEKVAKVLKAAGVEVDFEKVRANLKAKDKKRTDDERKKGNRKKKKGDRHDEL